MKIALGSDHAAVDEKAAVLHCLCEQGHEVTDCGPDPGESVDYPDYAEKVARLVASGEVERGILLCGSGIGMSMAANKIPGIRAALVHDKFTTQMSRQHNNANILCMGARVVSKENIVAFCSLWIGEVFDGDRHARRVDKIMKLDP